VKQALRNFDEGIAIGSTVPALYIYRGAVLSAQGDASSARADFEKVSHLIADQPWRFNSYAWALATSPVAAYRDGPAAIGYARRACELTSWKSDPELDTLAAAYAEAGQFDKALSGRQQPSNSRPIQAKRTRRGSPGIRKESRFIRIVQACCSSNFVSIVSPAEADRTLSLFRSRA
jgi:tetratricopeptide (TPR) repeat protein